MNKTTDTEAAGLQLPTFVRYDDESLEAGCHRDFVDDLEYRKAACHWLEFYFQPDWSKVEARGFTSVRGRGFGIYLEAADGSQPVSIELEGLRAGCVVLKAKEGHDIFDCIGRDLFSPIRNSWLELNGYPLDFPTCVECKVNGRCDLTVEVQVLA